MGFMTWINREAKSYYLWIFLFGVVFLRWGYSYTLLKVVGYQPDSSSVKGIGSMGVLLLGYALKEEMYYRLPLVICSYRSNSLLFVGAVVLFSSFIFGWIHGGISNVPLQGLGGILYSIVFLKCGGLQGSPFKALVSSTLCHTYYNFSLKVIPF